MICRRSDEQFHCFTQSHHRPTVWCFSLHWSLGCKVQPLQLALYTTFLPVYHHDSGKLVTVFMLDTYVLVTGTYIHSTGYSDGFLVLLFPVFLTSFFSSFWYIISCVYSNFSKGWAQSYIVHTDFETRSRRLLLLCGICE